MASKKRPRNTRWRPTTWERCYRGEPVWVEEMFIRDPKWSWSTLTGDEGRAKTRLAATRAAERAVDASLKRSTER